MEPTFTCTSCGGTFDKGRSDAEADAECLAVFGVTHRADDAVLCDDCYEAFMAAEGEAKAAWARQLLRRLDEPTAVEPQTLFGVPVRIDATLCENGELWIEGPTGEAVRVWPDAEKEPDA